MEDRTVEEPRFLTHACCILCFVPRLFVCEHERLLDVRMFYFAVIFCYLAGSKHTLKVMRNTLKELFTKTLYHRPPN